MDESTWKDCGNVQCQQVHNLLDALIAGYGHMASEHDPSATKTAKLISYRRESEKAKLPWPQSARMESGSPLWYAWHSAINAHRSAVGFEAMHFMYEAKQAAEELARLALLFEHERTGKMPKVHRQCSHSPLQDVSDNHLTCCLGVECRKCPHLLALDKTEASPTERDWLKAWTCVGHVLSKGGDVAGEGFITTTDDRMYWDTVYEHLASAEPTELNP